MNNLSQKQDVSGLMDQGKKYLESKDFVLAIECFSSILKMESDNVKAFHKRALAFAKIKNIASAIRDINNAIRIEGNEDYYYLRYVLLAGTREYHGALEDIDKCIDISPQKADYYIAKATCLQKMGETDQAVLASATGSDLDPSAKNLEVYAKALLAAGDTAGAINVCNNGLKEDHDKDLLLTRAAAKIKAGDDSAIEDITESFREGKTPLGLALLADYYYNKGDYYEAETKYCESLVLEKNPLNFLSRANVRREMGLHKLAIEDYQSYLNLTSTGSRSVSASIYDADTASIHKEIAEEYYRLGEYGKSINSSTKAISLNKHLQEAYMIRGLARIKVDDHSGAITDLSNVIMKNKKNVAAWVHRAIAKARTGDLTSALQDITQLSEMEISEKQRKSLSEMEKHLTTLSEDNSAESVSPPDKVLSGILDPYSSHAFYIQGMTALDNGDFMLAKKHLDKSIGVSPSPVLRRKINQALDLIADNRRRCRDKSLV